MVDYNTYQHPNEDSSLLHLDHGTLEDGDSNFSRRCWFLTLFSSVAVVGSLGVMAINHYASQSSKTTSFLMATTSPSPCPCFSAADLLAITKDNATEDSCEDTYEDSSLFELSNGVIAFSVSRTPWNAVECSSPKNEGLGISESEHDVCFELIYKRCDAIGKR